jgi:hypothetical protein
MPDVAAVAGVVASVAVASAVFVFLGDPVFWAASGPIEANPCGWSHADTVVAWMCVGTAVAVAAGVTYAFGRSVRTTLAAVVVAGGLAVGFQLWLAFPSGPVPC